MVEGEGLYIYKGEGGDGAVRCWCAGYVRS